LLVPLAEYDEIDQLFKKAKLRFRKVSVGPTSELTDAERDTLRREQEPLSGREKQE
jgi:hypothetical protein